MIIGPFPIWSSSSCVSRRKTETLAIRPPSSGSHGCHSTQAHRAWRALLCLRTFTSPSCTIRTVPGRLCPAFQFCDVGHETRGDSRLALYRSTGHSPSLRNLRASTSIDFICLHQFPQLRTSSRSKPWIAQFAAHHAGSSPPGAGERPLHLHGDQRLHCSIVQFSGKRARVRGSCPAPPPMQQVDVLHRRPTWRSSRAENAVPLGSRLSSRIEHKNSPRHSPPNTKEIDQRPESLTLFSRCSGSLVGEGTGYLHGPVRHRPALSFVHCVKNFSGNPPGNSSPPASGIQPHKIGSASSHCRNSPETFDGCESPAMRPAGAGPGTCSRFPRTSAQCPSAGVHTHLASMRVTAAFSARRCSAALTNNRATIPSPTNTPTT